MASRDLRVTLIGDDRTGTAFGSAGNNADGLTTKFANLGKGIGLALGGAAVAGIAGVGAAMVQGVKDAASYEKITDQVAQTIKSTGAAAGVSVGGLKEYAGQLESMSGVDEELILSGQNVLLTFTNVQNKVGDGNNIFDQASQAALNLSTTMGGDLVGANTLVGKALNDPIAGMTALRRAGVQLTDAQKDQVTAMVESGDVMGAQKVLLGELETQFGGAAKAAGEGLTGSIARAKDAFQDMFRGIATALLPKLAELAQFFTNTLMPGIKGVYDLVIGGDFTGALREAFGWEEDSGPVKFLTSVRENFLALWPHIKAVAAAMLDIAKAVIPVLLSAFQAVGSAVGAVVGFFQRHDTAAKALGVVVGAVAVAVGAAWVAQAAVSTANAARAVIAWVVTATASTTSATIQSKSTAQIVFGWVAAAAGAVVNAAVVVGGWVLMGVQSLANAARMAAAWLIAMGPVGWVIAAVIGLVALIVANWDTVVSWTKTAWEAVVGAVSAAWEWIKGAVGSALEFVKNLFLNFTGPGLIIKHWETIKNAFSNGVNAAVGFVRDLPGKVIGFFANAGSWLVDAGKNLLQGLWNGISGAGSWLKGKIMNWAGNLLPGWVKDILGIHSPSTVFAEIGRYLMLGMAVGIDSEAKTAVDAALAAASAITDAMQVQAPDLMGLANAQAMGGLAAQRALIGGSSTPAAAQSAVTVAPSGPAVNIENYNEARQPVHEIAQEFAFLARTR